MSNDVVHRLPTPEEALPGRAARAFSIPEHHAELSQWGP